MNKVICVGKIVKNILEVKVDPNYVDQAEAMQERFLASIELSKLADAVVEVVESTTDEQITATMFDLIHKNHLKNKQY